MKKKEDFGGVWENDGSRTSTLKILMVSQLTVNFWESSVGRLENYATPTYTPKVLNSNYFIKIHIDILSDNCKYIIKYVPILF